MAPRTRTVLAGLGLTVLLAGVLTACATGSGGTPTQTGAGNDSTEQEVTAAWLDGGRMIGIVTQGSSSCIPTAEDVSYADGVMKVTLVDPKDDTPCTADLASRVTMVGTPEGADPAEGVEIEVTGDGWHGDTDLEGAVGLSTSGETDYLPSAGWTETDGQFVILSWGSSTCVPVVEKTELTSATEVTVTFATPPADQVCTMDMAPRGVVTTADGVDDEDVQVYAILTGGEFDNVRVPINPN
jgi:hypothetical protein